MAIEKCVVEVWKESRAKGAFAVCNLHSFAAQSAKGSRDWLWQWRVYELRRTQYFVAIEDQLQLPGATSYEPSR